MRVTKYNVGYRITPDDSFVKCIIDNKQYINEVYFAWPQIANGRNSTVIDGAMYEWEAVGILTEALKRFYSSGISNNLLLNGNCYGRYSQSRMFFNKIGDVIDFLYEGYGLKSVTTTSPLIAKFIKSNFRKIDVRASVNMEIGTVEGMDYIADYFDSYYMKRELNRDFGAIMPLKEWCNANGKKLYMLANSGCMNNCSAHNFHDNLVAHESEIAQMDNAYDFHGICSEYLKKKEHYQALIDNTNFIRPEDMGKYDGIFEAAKLATRIHKNPCMVLKSYVNEKYSGNILDLLEPSHSIYPYVVQNGEPLRIVKLDENMLI